MTSDEISGEDARSSVRGLRFPVMATVALFILLLWSLAATILFLDRDAALRLRKAELDDHLRRATAQAAETADGLERLGVNVATSRQYQDELTQRLKLAERQLAEMRASQEQLLARFGSLARGRIGQMEKIIATTGLDVNRLVPPKPSKVVKPAAKPTDKSKSPVKTRVKPSAGNKAGGQGGPFLAAGPQAGGDSQGLDDLLHHMDRWDGLDQALRMLPLGVPLESFTLTSGYGLRRDPFNGRLARHEGLDFMAPLRAPVFATADGRVVEAGWRSRYGLMVEVDHGKGLRTRYAHLSRILVQSGQSVQLGSRIGLLGSSGRSTGPHLHYEVLVDDVPRDPLTFIRAAPRVIKARQ